MDHLVESIDVVERLMDEEMLIKYLSDEQNSGNPDDRRLGRQARLPR